MTAYRWVKNNKGEYVAKVLGGETKTGNAGKQLEYPQYQATSQDIEDMFSNVSPETSRQNVEQYYQNLEEFSRMYPQMFWEVDNEQEFVINDHLLTWIHQQAEMWDSDCNLQQIAQGYDRYCKLRGGIGYF